MLNYQPFPRSDVKKSTSWWLVIAVICSLLLIIRVIYCTVMMITTLLRESKRAKLSEELFKDVNLLNYIIKAEHTPINTQYTTNTTHYNYNTHYKQHTIQLTTNNYTPTNGLHTKF